MDPRSRCRERVVEFSEEEPTEGRRGSVVDRRAASGRFSEAGRELGISVAWGLVGESVRAVLCFLERVGAVWLLCGWSRSMLVEGALVKWFSSRPLSVLSISGT